MSNLRLSIALILFTFKCLAQPVLNSSEIPDIGFSTISRTVNGNGINPGPAGYNQSWNFTAFPDTGLPVSKTWVNPAETPNGSQFPEATHALEYEQPAGTIYRLYYKANETSMELVGKERDWQAFINPYLQIYTNPALVFSFPCGFDSLQTDNYRVYSNESLGFLGTAYYESGGSSYEIDGLGTLETTSGIYPNTLRIKRRQISTDSSFSQTFPGQFSLTITNKRSTNYEWLNLESGSMLPVWSISLDTAITQGNQTTSKTVVHTVADLSSFARNNFIKNELHFFPNPAGSQITLQLRENATVVVRDMGGRVIQARHYVFNETAPTMDLSSVESGIYSIQIVSKNFRYNGILVKVD